LSRVLAEFALKLYDIGFNIVPVDVDKKPLCSWSSSKRISREKLEELLQRASGIAVVGGFENPWRDANAVLILIDVDNPQALEKSQTLRDVISKTVSWCTGVRCPSCFEKHVSVLEYGKKFKCSRCGKEFTVGEAKRGLGALVTVDYTTYEKLFKGSLRLGDVEFLVNNYQLIPPSVHGTGVAYEWVKPFNFSLPNLGICALTEVEVEAILNELKPRAREDRERPGGVKELRELSDTDIIKLKELLKTCYIPGKRQFIWLYLSGWGAKARISPVAIAKLLKMLYEETGDSDHIKTRASAIVYSYKKYGVDVESYGEELEKVLGVRPYGLEKEIRDEEVKGKSGLQEVLEEVLGEEQALNIIKEIEDVFGVASPYRDSVVEILDYEKQLYAVANLRKLVVVRARRSGNRMIYRERVAIGAPTNVVVYVNPIGGVTKYQITWETATRPKPLTIGPALLEEVVDRIKAEGLVVSSRLVGDVLAALVEGFVRKGRAEVRYEIEAPGFYIINNKLTPIRFGVSKPGFQELREALELLNELAEVWFRHIQAKFATAIRWGAIAPFIYAYKQCGRWVKWLYLYGASKTGKTTLGEIILRMWGLDTRFIKSGANIDTVARLGHVLSQSTFPVLVNEPGCALVKEDIVEVVKNSVENLVARGKYVRGSYIDIPALAPLIFTSNRYIPRDDALLRRLKILRFTYGERISEERAREFDENVKPRLGKLKAIGFFIAWYATENGLEEEYEAYSVKLLEEAFRAIGLEAPHWIRLGEEGSELDIYEDMRERIRAFILKRINEEYSRFVGKVIVERYDKEYTLYTIQKSELPLVDRVKIVVEKQLIPWLIGRGNEVIITTELVSELQEVVGDIGGLKSIAELLDWIYIKKKIGKRSVWVITTSLENFIEFLTPSIE